MNNFSFRSGPFVCTDGRLQMSSVPTLEQLEETLSRLAWMQRHIYWWIGDALMAGERIFGDDAYQAVDPNFSADLMQRCISIAAKYPPEARNNNLSWSHHVYAAKLEPRLRVAALRKAEVEGWNTQQFQAYLKNVWAKRVMLEPSEISQDEGSVGSQD